MSLPINVNAKDLIDGITRATTTLQNAGAADGMQFLKLQKGTDVWIYGQDAVEVEQDSVWAINPGSFVTGYQAWGAGDLLGEEFRSITAPPVMEQDLPPVGASWKSAAGFELVCTSGEDIGTQVRYITTSRGGLRAVSDLFNALLEQIKAKPDTAAIVPLVTLEASSYAHKKYGKIYTPVFSLRNFTTYDASFNTVQLETNDPEPEPEPEPEPPRRRRRSRAAA